MNRMRSSFHPIYSSCIRSIIGSPFGKRKRGYFGYWIRNGSTTRDTRKLERISRTNPIDRSKSGAKRFSTCGKNSVTRSSYTCTDERISIPIRGNALFFAISWKDRFTKGRSRSGNHPRPVRKQEIRETIKALVADCSLPEGFDSSCVASGEKQRDTFFAILPQ